MQITHYPRQLLHRFWIPACVAVLVACLYGMPYIVSIVQLGSRYHGIPMMVTGDEETYVARMHDILDGHPMLGSPVFFEYKDQIPLLPPTGEWLYILPSLVFGANLIDVVIASKFIVPALLALAVYVCALSFFEERNRNVRVIAGAISLAVLCGYDVVDFRQVVGLLRGSVTPSAFLIWSRLVNPITGAIALFVYLASLNRILKGSQSWRPMTVGAIALAFMFASYFFSWAYALTITLCVSILLAVTRRLKLMKRLLALAGAGILLAAPYWYMLARLFSQPSYMHGEGLSALFHTHQPVINKFVLLMLIVFCAALFLWRRYEKSDVLRDNAVLMMAACVLASCIVFMQQIVTGVAIWPFHFVQYTIPVLIMILYLIIYRSLRFAGFAWIRTIGKAALFYILPLCALLYAITLQSRVYAFWVPTVIDQQRYAAVFQWLDEHTDHDCVVLTREGADDNLNALVPGFTHCNVYTSNYRFLHAPNIQERFEHNYFTQLRLHGITPATAPLYIRDHEREARSYLGDTLQEYFGEQKFSDVPLSDFKSKIGELSILYKKFYEQDFRTELEKYRIDVLISTTPLASDVIGSIQGLHSEGELNGVSVYTL